MKTLNITKERFDESRYFQKKYGKLECVSESEGIYKNEAGKTIKFTGKKPNLKKPDSKKPVNKKLKVDEPSDMDGDDYENTPPQKKKGFNNSKPKRFNNFNDLKKYIERQAYNKEVGAAIDGDGRLGSVTDEGNIILWLNEIFDETNVEVIKPPARYWYDIELKVGSKSYYTNIKTTAGGADNISSKEGVLYYLSGGQTSDYKTFMKNRGQFSLNDGDETADYFLLVMFKDSKRIIFTSLGRLGVLTPNFYNQPFQIPWNKSVNQDGKANGRNPKQQKQYVASIWYKSISMGLEKLDYLRNTFKRIAGEYAQDI